MDSPAGKPQRVLACQACQQRKVKCDRRFPCANCVRSQAQCVPAGLVPRQRRRRFPERELLARIRHYESVLQQHKISFEPLHPGVPTSAAGATPEPLSESPEGLVDGRPASPDTSRTEVPTTIGSARGKSAEPRATNLWNAVNQKIVESDDDGDDDDGDDNHDYRDSVLKNVWDRTYLNDSESNHHLLFGSPAGKMTLTTMHPDQGKIFRLWQIYLDNVNPLLKVTHTPTLQPRIVDAMGDLASIHPSLEALLFGIYCIAVLSISEDQCRALFGSPKKDVLSGYQFACRQALINCNILRWSDRDSLTAMFLNLVSARSATDPRSLSSVLAVAMRLAQRMGYHDESHNARCTPFEAEMRRRLWWALVVFDNRVCEVLNYRMATLAPTWTCRTPLNLNDFELLPDAKTLPSVHDKPTEALFVVVRSELSDFVRHSPHYLDFIDPLLTTFAQAKLAATGKSLPVRSLLELQDRVESQTLSQCDPQNPLHYMTIWTTRAYLAKNLLLEHCSRQHHQQHQHHPRDAGLAHALRMLACDTNLITSPLTPPYRWSVHTHFPALAYMYIVQYLRKRRHQQTTSTTTTTAEERQAAADEEEEDAAWDALSANYAAHHHPRPSDGGGGDYGESPFYMLFSRIVLQAWEGGRGRREGEGRLEVPGIVVGIRREMAKRVELKVGEEMQQGVVDDGLSFGMGGVVGGIGVGGQGFAAAAPVPPGGGYTDGLAGNSGMEFMDLDQLWPTIDWGLTQKRLW